MYLHMVYFLEHVIHHKGMSGATFMIIESLKNVLKWFFETFRSKEPTCRIDSDFPSLAVLWFAEGHSNQSSKDFKPANHVWDMVI